MMRTCTSLPESESPPSSVIAVVSCPEIGLDSSLLGIAGGSCDGGMLLDIDRRQSRRFGPYTHVNNLM